MTAATDVALAVVPATADILGKTASGLADDLLSTVLLAATGKILWAPAMNKAMWAHPAVQGAQLDPGKDVRGNVEEALGEAIEVAPHYRRLVFDIGYSEMRFVQTEQQARLSWHVVSQALPYCRSLAESLIASWYHFGRWMAGVELPLEEVLFLHEAPADLRPYLAFFECPVRFGAGEFEAAGLAYGHGIVGNLKAAPWKALLIPAFLVSFGLAARRFEVLAAHDADADTGADGTQTDHEAGGEGDKADDFHLVAPVLEGG